MSALVLNTRTGRHVKVGSPTYKKTLASGYQQVGSRLLPAKWAALQRRLEATGSRLMLDPADDFERVNAVLSEHEATQARIQASRARAATPIVPRAPATGADALVWPVMTDAEFNAFFGITPDLPAQELFSLWSDRGQLAVPTPMGPVSVGFGLEASAALSAYADANMGATPTPVSRGPILDNGDAVAYFSYDSLRLDAATAEAVVGQLDPHRLYALESLSAKHITAGALHLIEANRSPVRHTINGEHYRYGDDIKAGSLLGIDEHMWSSGAAYNPAWICWTLRPLPVQTGAPGPAFCGGPDSDGFANCVIRSVVEQLRVLRRGDERTPWGIHHERRD